ncbi:MAG TPA: menaquinone biosynthesis protein [Chthoniobacterales bacterium]|nr:menaquinone biosynthesis protein [Chthoniobacterales bacterium]
MPASDDLRSLRIGCVKYLNARPLIHGWRGEVRFDHPSILCRELAAGQLDLALVSSFEYLRHPIYAIVDRLAIASHGPVYSVILAHLGALETLREVALDPASETSVSLLRCLLGKRALAPTLVAGGELSPTRGRLLIGDQAIRFREKAPDEMQILDLGAAWREATGLPFVYALWLIRPDYPAKKAIADSLRTLARTNLENLEDLIAAEPEATRAFCEFYFRQCLRFSLGEDEKRGFQTFAQLCISQQLLPALPPIPEFV